MEDYYTEGWAALRQCAIDGQHILNCGADTSVPQVRGGPDEQDKAELLQLVSLFLFSSPFSFPYLPFFSHFSVQLGPEGEGKGEEGLSTPRDGPRELEKLTTTSPR